MIQFLQEHHGEITTAKDASQSEIPDSQQSFVAAENGYDLNLTINVNIQSIVEKCLKEGVETNNCSKGGNCIVMNPQNGQIIAMASYPDYDLNNPRTPTSYYANDWDTLSSSDQTTRLLDMWKVRSVSETYEPGSVFKLITASVALEENITETDVEGEFICNGYEQVKDRKIQCWYFQYPNFKTHGHQTLREALMNSCNPALIQLGRRIGAETMWKYMDAFGLFDKTGVGLSGESSGVFFKSINDINEVELATLSFGQRFTVTPLQMCTAVSAIANGGTLIKPQIVKSITNTDTGEVTEFNTTKVRQVISTRNCKQSKRYDAFSSN